MANIQQIPRFHVIVQDDLTVNGVLPTGYCGREESEALKILKMEDIESVAHANEILNQCKHELEKLVEQILVENKPDNAELVAALLAAIKSKCAIH